MGAVSPSGSLASDFDSSTTVTDTVVVAVGDSGTDQGRAAHLAANAIAQRDGYTVIRVPGDGALPYSVVQTLSQRVAHGDLRQAIVVGVGENRTDSVATALTAVGAEVDGKEVTLDVRDQIYGDSPSDLLYRATVQTWSDATAAYVTTTTKTDDQRVTVALSNSESAPVLGESMGYSDLNATLDYLGVTTVYVSPGVSTSTRDNLRDDGYTVDESPNGVSLDQSVSQVASDYTPTTVEDVVVVSPGYLPVASQTGSGANATVLVTESSTSLGNATKNKLANLSAVDNVYVLGSDEQVSDEVFSTISNTVRANASTDRIIGHHGTAEMYLRTSLLVSGYTYGVLVSHVSASENGNVTVDVTNIGFSTVLTVDDTSATLSWEGKGIESSSPSGVVQNGKWVVTNDQDMDPGEQFTVSLQVDSKPDNGGHPYLSYYVGESGALIGASGGLGAFLDFLHQKAGWLIDMVDPLLPTLDLHTTSPYVLGLVGASAVVVGVGVVFSFKSWLHRSGRRRMR